MQIVGNEPPTVERIRERRERLEVRLRDAAESAGRDPGGFRILAVTKEFPVEVCRAALAAGLEMLGENRVQEAEPKIAELPDAEWHLVGRLQSNKARRAVIGFAAIHSVDSLDLLTRLERLAAEEGRRTRLLLEVNLSGERTKAGFDGSWFAAQAEQGGELVDAVRGVHAADLVGLMTMARIGAAHEEARETFRRLRELRDALQEVSGVGLPELSMGMTADAEAAVAEGATLVRIGTALFGPRHA